MAHLKKFHLIFARSICSMHGCLMQKKVGQCFRSSAVGCFAIQILIDRQIIFTWIKLFISFIGILYVQWVYYAVRPVLKHF